MDKIKEYLSYPGTRISLIIFMFGLGCTYATFNNRLTSLEEFKEQVDIVKLNTTLTQIQSDISRIKLELQSNKK